VSLRGKRQLQWKQAPEKLSQSMVESGIWAGADFLWQAHLQRPLFLKYALRHGREGPVEACFLLVLLPKLGCAAIIFSIFSKGYPEAVQYSPSYNYLLHRLGLASWLPCACDDAWW
jgi:hypothetical protein